MTDPLLSPTDFASFQAKDPNWFLGAAGETIRDRCGWHIAPVVSTTGYKAKIGNKGIIMLPTLKLVSVENLTIATYPDNPLDATMYEIHEEGWLQFHGYLGRRGRNASVTVDFTHGYEEVPRAVAEVGFELTGRTMEKPTGVVKHMTRGPTDLDFLEFGAVLSDDQIKRLGPYTLTRV
jgi:hypothetical protein